MPAWRPAVRRTAVLVDRWHWGVLLLAAPLLLFPTPARSPALLVVPGLWLAAALAGRAPLPRTPLNGALLLLSVMLLVSLGATYDVAVSLPKIAGMVLGLGMFFGVARLATGRQRLAALAGLVLSSLVLAVLGLVGVRWLDKSPLLAPLMAYMPELVLGLPGAEGGIHPNELAGSLVWLVPLVWALAIVVWRPVAWPDQLLGARWIGPARAALIGVAVLSSGILLLTQSRAALMGLGGSVALLAAGWAAKWGLRRYGARGRAGLAVGAVAALGLAIVAGRGPLQRVLDPSRAPLEQAPDLGTLAGRLEVWSRAVDAIGVFPLTGMGMNTFRRVVFVLFPLASIGSDFDLGHAHNELLQAALDLGLPGLLALLAIYWVTARQLWALAAGPAGAWPKPLEKAVAWGLAAGLLAHFLFGLVDALALGAKPGIVFWLILGLVANLHADQPAPASASRTFASAPAVERL